MSANAFADAIVQIPEVTDIFASRILTYDTGHRSGINPAVHDEIFSDTGVIKPFILIRRGPLMNTGPTESSLYTQQFYGYIDVLIYQDGDSGYNHINNAIEVLSENFNRKFVDSLGRLYVVTIENDLRDQFLNAASYGILTFQVFQVRSTS